MFPFRKKKQTLTYWVINDAPYWTQGRMILDQAHTMIPELQAAVKVR